jgi:benzoyl-CoA reductase/2-hydroxyglutaryl-CoA dehydratase subunit BcrC/BadD/HgdB
VSERVLPSAVPDDLARDRAVGITTTVPVEVIFAAGLLPVDLNNLFITAPDPGALAADAERAGFPRTTCCWTKGIYGAVRSFKPGRVLAVTRGDCSNAEALVEILRHEGVECLTFDYPPSPDSGDMEERIAELCGTLGTELQAAEEWRAHLAAARAAAMEIDRLSWAEDCVHGIENHLWTVSASDFCAAPEVYADEAAAFVRAAPARAPIVHNLRLGLCGVPPIVPDIYDFVEEMGALVVYNETQLQFVMPNPSDSLAEQYARYTYPYGVFTRLDDIQAECKRRRLDGLIHYVQSFCHRRIEDRIIRQRIDLPVLTLEADRPGPLSGQMRTRLEAFVQMLTARKTGRHLV